ncbi:MAG: EamA family transporter [Acidimicrobiia bacterium]|nr:EamA family transporter [Acidimicrobiia bacterium]
MSVTLVLAVSGAVFYGLADFSGGYAARRLPPWLVTFVSQSIGLVALFAGLIIFPASRVTSGDVLWGAVAGLGGVIGIGLLYRSLAEGTMAIVSPITAATTAAIPVVVDLATGASLSATAGIGVLVAITAIVIIAGERSATRLSPRLLGMALLAGAGFAAFFIAIAQTSEASGFWPLLGARAVTIPLGWMLHRSLETPVRPDRLSLRWVALAGMLDMGANLLVTAALQQGPLGIVSVLSSLYPVVTALTAVAVIGERLTRVQLAGVGLAMTAVVLLVA